MPLLPYRSVTIHSALTPDEAVDRLSAYVEPKRLIRFSFPLASVFGFGSGRRAFEGSVRGYRFTIRRLINYQNSLLPEIRGRIEPAAQGSRIHLTMRLHRFVLLFLGVSLAGMLLFFVQAGQNDVTAMLNETLPITVPAGAAGGWALFAWETRKAARLLADLFDASEVERG